MERCWATFLVCTLTVTFLVSAQRHPESKRALSLHCQSNIEGTALQLTEKAFQNSSDLLGSYITNLPDTFPSGTWLQIGADDLDPQGSQNKVNDSLLKLLPLYAEYRKIFVEPIPFIFSKLQTNTRSLTNVDLVNAAIVPIGDASSKVTMYCPAEEDSHERLVGICSLNEDVVKSFSSRPRSIAVDALTVPQLFYKYRISNMRVAIIDTKGYDVKLLQLLLQYPEFRPELVVFEHSQVAPGEHQDGINMLHSHCYACISDRNNTYGLKLLSWYGYTL